MSAIVEDILSDSYLEAFYKAHVAASRRSNLDEDIAAIEAEIRKVQQVRSRVQSYRVSDGNHHLNSCGNSECSDDEEFGGCESDTRDLLSTSVFRVYNSTTPLRKPRPKGPDVFSWALQQIVNHDHNYCGSQQQECSTPMNHDDLTLNSVLWHQQTAAKRSLTLKKLRTILQNSPSNRKFPTSHPLPLPHSSLSLLPHSLAETLRTQKGLGMTPTSMTKTKPRPQQLSTKVDNNQASTVLHPSQHAPSSNSSIRTRKKHHHSPYDRRNTGRSSESSWSRNIRTYSEGEDSIEID